MSKFCEKCGNQLNDDDVFCEKCGTRVESGEMTNSTDTAQSVSGSVSQQATVQPEVVILQKKKMNPLKNNHSDCFGSAGCYTGYCVSNDAWQKCGKNIERRKKGVCV